MEEIGDNYTSIAGTQITQHPLQLDPTVDGSHTGHGDDTLNFVDKDDEHGDWVLLKLPRSLSLPNTSRTTTDQTDISQYHLAWRTRSWPKAHADSRPADDFTSYLARFAHFGRFLIRNVVGDEPEYPLFYPGRFLQPEVTDSLRVEEDGSSAHSPAGYDCLPQRPEAPCGCHAFKGIGAWYDAAQNEQ